MANKRVITVKINADGKEIRATTEDVKRLEDGLRDLDVRQAREAQQTLKALGHTDLKNAVQQLQDLKQATAGLDDKSIRQFSRVLQSEMETAAESGEDYLNVLRRFKPELDQLANNLKNGSISQEDYNRRVASLPPIMQRAIADSRKFGTEIKGVGEEVDKASKQFDKLKNAGATVQNFGNSIQGIGQSLTVGVTLPIISLGVAAVKTFADVESAVANISSIKPEIDTKQVFTALNEMSTRIPQTAQQLGDGLYNIFSSINVTQSEALKLLEQFGKGATAAQTDAQTFGTAVLGVINAYKLSVNDAAHISDVFFNTVNLGVVNGQELASTLGVVTQAAKNAGVGFDELGALIVGVTKEGGEASQNINNLANFLQKLPTKESSAALKQLGVDVQIDGKFRPVIDVLSDLKLKLDELPESARALELQKIFPDAQARTGAQVLLSQLDAIKEALELNKTTAGAAEEAYKKIAATATVQFSLLKNTGIAILSELGSAILPVLQPLIIWLTQNLIPAVKQAVEVFKSWSPQMQTVAVAVAGVVAAVGPFLAVLGSVIVAIGAVISAWGTIGAVLAGVSLTPIIAGIAAAVGTLIAVSAALVIAWQNDFGGIRAFTSVVAQTIQNVWNSSVTAIADLTKEVTSEINQFWTANGADIMQAVGTVSEYIKSTWQSVVAFWTANGDTIKSVTSAVWNIVKAVVIQAVQTIANVIKLVVAVINGDWKSGFEALRDITLSAVNATLAILKGAASLFVGAIKLSFNGIWALAGWVNEQGQALGRNIALGIMNGISSLSSAVVAYGRSLISSIFSGMNAEAQTQSPSKVTTEIGQFIAEGLAVGMEKRIGTVKASAKKLATETIKELRSAMQEFQKLAGASPETVGIIQGTDRIKDAANAQREIIKLRGELNANKDIALPTTVAGTESELKYLQNLKKAGEEVAESLKKSNDYFNKLADDAKKADEDFQKRLQDMESAGNLALIKLQEEIDLTGVASEADRQRISNYYEIKRLREEMASDGYGEQQIKEAAEILRIEQARQLELQRILEIRKQVAEASSFEVDLQKRLFETQRGGRELTEYEKTLQKINTDWKDISKSQKDSLLTTAAQIDAQKQYNEQYQQTYDFIRGALDVLTDSGKSFGDKMRSIFGGIFQSFKKMILDMTAQWLTSKLFGAGSAGGSQSGGVGGLFSSLLGIGSNSPGGTPTFSPFAPNSNSGALGFGGNSFSGLINPGKSQIGTRIQLPDGTIYDAGKSGGGFGNNVGTYGAIGGAATLVGGLFGNDSRIGGLISGAGQGLALGAQIGSIIPGVGTLIGAGVGAAVGGLIGLFSSGGKKRKEDAKQNMPALREGFANSIKEFQQLISDLEAVRIGSSEAIKRGEEIRSQISSGFNIDFKSKKYRKVARKEISSQLNLIDQPGGLMEQLKAAAERRRQAEEFNNQFVATFAGGGYTDAAFMNQYGAFKQQYGLLKGGTPGVDSIPVLAMQGELFLNKNQQSDIIRGAGYDVFSHASIPNYPGSPKPTKMATGGFVGSGNISFAGASGGSVVIEELHIHLDTKLGVSEQSAAEITNIGLKTADGKKAIVKTIRTHVAEAGANSDGLKRDILQK